MGNKGTHGSLRAAYEADIEDTIRKLRHHLHLMRTNSAVLDGVTAMQASTDAGAAIRGLGGCIAYQHAGVPPDEVHVVGADGTTVVLKLHTAGQKA